VRFAGFGGQGIVLCGFIFGKAAMLEGKNSVQTQSYGSASRGGLTKSDVSIEDGEIHDLVHDKFDILVTLSQASYEKYQVDLLPGGHLFYESELMSVAEDGDRRCHGVGVTDIAFKKFGRKIMANVIMTGFVNEMTGLLTRESVEQTIRESVPPKTVASNLEAYAEGARLAAEHRGR
jgi:2-oxoglutarate ferredoxin oxidoreductase subunit gamma